MNVHGNLIDRNQILMDGVSIGDGSSTPKATLSTERYVGLQNGKLRLEVRAKTALTIATDKKFFVEILSGATGACAAPVSGGHQFGFYKDSGDDEKVFAAGDLIASFGITKQQSRYFQIKSYTDEDHTTETLDAYLVND
jgi:hypothetical protein